MIPTRDNYVEWFTCAVRFHFLREGYAFLSFSVDQLADPGFPAERLIVGGSRFVGLHFLLPAVDSAAQRPLGYLPDPDLPRFMSEPGGSWLRYALPQSADPLDQQLTQQKVLFAGAAGVSLASDGSVLPEATLTFKQLVAQLEGGECGFEVPSGYTATDLLALTGEYPVSLYLGMDRKNRIVTALKDVRSA